MAIAQRADLSLHNIHASPRHAACNEPCRCALMVTYLRCLGWCVACISCHAAPCPRFQLTRPSQASDSSDARQHPHAPALNLNLPSPHQTSLLCAVPDPATSPFELQSSPDVTPQKPSFQPPGLEGPTTNAPTMPQESPVGQADPVLLRPPRHGSSDFALDELARVVRASSNSGIWSMAPGPVRSLVVGSSMGKV